MRVLIVPNTDNGAAVSAAAELASWLTARGDEPLMLPEDALAVGRRELALSTHAAPAPGLVIALGGDGTILRAVHALDGEEVPVLGVNLGRLGFLTGTDVAEMREVVGAALSGEVRTDRLATLTIEVEADGRTRTFSALNEVFVGRGAGARAVELAIAVDGAELMRFYCDGLICATPTGSTAYALSVGGPILAPSVSGTLLVPVGAHTLQQRPVVLGPDETVDLTCPNPARSDACVVVDGIQHACERLGRVRVARGSREVPLVRPHGQHFYEVVRRKFLGGC